MSIINQIKVEDVLYDILDDNYVHTDNNYSDEEKSSLLGKQDELVSGENIKTINNQSILGEGNATSEQLGLQNKMYAITPQEIDNMIYGN